MKNFTYKIIIVFIVLLFTSNNASFVQGQTYIKSKKLAGLEKKISLDLKGINVLDLLKFIAREGDLNLVVDKDVNGTITMFLKDIKIKDALDIAVAGNNLAYAFNRDVISVMSAAKYELIYGTKFNDRRKTKTIKLKYAKPEIALSLLEKIKSKIGSVIIDKGTRSVIVIDTPSKLIEIQSAINTIDQPIETRSIFLKYAETEVVLANITNLLTSGIGQATSDKSTRTLVLTDYVEKLNKLENVINALDRKRKQVLIEAKIVKVELSNDFNMGIDWQYLLSSAKSLDIVGSFPLSLASPAQKISIGEIPSDDLTAAITVLETFGNTELLSSPYITVMDGQEAKILVGQVQPVISETTTSSQGLATITPSVEYLDLGIKLFVKPKITEDNYISMEIKPEVSELLGFETSSQGSKFPIRETSEAETTVIVKNGVTIIIAGLIKTENKKEEKRVPILGQIPLLGALFRSTVTNKLKSELVTFITPHIISGDRNLEKIADTRKIRKKRRDIDTGKIRRKPRRVQ